MIVISRIHDLNSDNAVYEVRINDQRISTFAHKPSRGLAECLMAASKSVSMKLDDALLMKILDGEVLEENL